VIQFGSNQLIMIGERLSPGYKSVRAMIDANDIAGLQELCRKQADAGAGYLDVHLGQRGATDLAFVEQVVRGLQEAVSCRCASTRGAAVPSAACAPTIGHGRRRPAAHQLHLEPRWELMELRKIAPFKVVLMASERLEDGAAKSNKSGAEIAATAKRCVTRLVQQHGLAMDDIFVDISVRALIADTEGMTRGTLEAVRLIHEDPDLRGVRIMGAITNIGQPPIVAADGST
jgi:5-methyltetrahydrofolate--homocysteine methyltransferase